MKNPAVPKAFGTRYLIVRSYYFHIRSLTPQQAARNALAIRFNAQKLADILDRLDAAENVGDMKFPGSDLHQLKGKMKGHWAVKVSGNWRVVFRFEEGNAYDVDYTDYH
jgi:proteic killer suppression protein